MTNKDWSEIQEAAWQLGHGEAMEAMFEKLKAHEQLIAGQEQVIAGQEQIIAAQQVLIKLQLDENMAIRKLYSSNENKPDPDYFE
jgi:hypothetical protein